MKRHTFALEVASGEMGKFRVCLGEVWKELTLFLDKCGIVNFSIWNVERIIFGYYESDDNFSFGLQEREQVKKWEERYCKNYSWISIPFEAMRLMYHDFGIVRTNKELIRHRVFVAKLHEGMEEQYKQNHDDLIKARGDSITKGPDSNFSIWYAGGYIFGYNEIDTTMEHDATDVEKESTIAWETKMIQIMDWITNDVDWITGERHENIKRIGWHN